MWANNQMVKMQKKRCLQPGNSYCIIHSFNLRIFYVARWGVKGKILHQKGCRDWKSTSHLTREESKLREHIIKSKGYWSLNDLFCSGSRTSSNAEAGSPRISEPVLSTSSSNMTGLHTPTLCKLNVKRNDQSKIQREKNTSTTIFCIRFCMV